MMKGMLPMMTCVAGAMLVRDHDASDEYWCLVPSLRWTTHISHDRPVMQAANAIAKVTMVITGNPDIADIVIVKRIVVEMTIEMSLVQSLNRRRFSARGSPPPSQK